MSEIIQGPTMNAKRDPEASTSFRMRTTPQNRCWKLPRRYVLAIMCNLAFFLRGWTVANLTMIFYHLFVLEDGDRELHLPTIANFTEKESQDIHKTYDSAYIIGQIPAAMLIIKFTPYHIMQYSMVLSSFLQLITPWTIQISASLFIANVFVQGLCSCPLDCACIGLWREWAPPAEKTRLLMISFSGRYIYFQIAVPLCLFLSETVGPVSLHYFAGIAGLIWCILWNNLISDTPTNDPLVSEAELHYIEDQIPSENKEKITLSSVPVRTILKSFPVLSLCFVFISSLSSVPVRTILKSFPVLSLCFVFISSGLSSQSMVHFIFIQVNLMLSGYNVDWMIYTFAVNCIVLVPAAGFLTDFLINRKIMETTTIRKILCSGGLILHAFFMLLFMLPDLTASIACLKISLMIFPFTLAGVLPNILDLSPRYACVIIAVAMIVHAISRMFYDLFLVHMLLDWTTSEWIRIFIPVEVLAVLAAIIFAIFGSGKEQEWSISAPPSERTQENDSQYYPQSNLEDEMLITGGL